MSDTFFVSLSPSQAANRIQEGIVRGSITGELIDSYSISTKEGYSVSVLLFEKHYYRAGNRLTLTVTIDDFTGKTGPHRKRRRRKVCFDSIGVHRKALHDRQKIY